ncbi:MAG: restriction endonuclease [Muribaculaceae bacterium]|nr:restriction endonuclease [Muribaculaceae bacterium]
MIPSFQKYLLPFLEVMNEGSMMDINTISSKIAKKMKLSDQDLDDRLESGQNRHLNRCSWAKTWCMKAGLISRPQRARFEITDEGRKLLGTGIKEITQKYLADHYPSFAEFSQNRNQTKHNSVDCVKSDHEEVTPMEQIERAYKDIIGNLIDDLLAAVKEQTPKFFEELVVLLLVRMGYGGDFEDAAEVTQYSNDGGIDGIIKEDALGLDKIYIQAKRWTDKCVGGPDIQQFIGALINVGATKGIYITTSTFSEAARRQIRNSGSLKIVLIDGQELARLMIKHNVGVVVDRSFEVKRVDVGFFKPEE